MAQGIVHTASEVVPALSSQYEIEAGFAFEKELFLGARRTP
jgi:hypothetical protein